LYFVIIKSYNKKYNVTSIDTLDKFINKYNYEEEFQNTNFNKIKGGVHKYISKSYSFAISIVLLSIYDVGVYDIIIVKNYKNNIIILIK